MAASKSHLIDDVKYRTQWPANTATTAVESVLDAIAALAEKERLIIRGFGTFEMKTRAARTARNVRTGEMIEVPASTRLTFKPAKKA